MAHIDLRLAAAYYPDPCKMRISRYPMAVYMLSLWITCSNGSIKALHRCPFHFYAGHEFGKRRVSLALDEFGNVGAASDTFRCGPPALRIRARTRRFRPLIRLSRRAGSEERIPQRRLHHVGSANDEVPMTLAASAESVQGQEGLRNQGSAEL